MKSRQWRDLSRRIVLAAALAAMSLGSAVAQTANLEGILTIQWGDPRPGTLGGGATRFNLTTADGATHALSMGTAQQNVAIGYFGKRVTVQGQVTGVAPFSDNGGGSTIAVDRVELAEPAVQPEVQPTAAVTRRVLYILLRFKGDTQKPRKSEFFRRMTNPKTASAGIPATINGFFDKTSWSKLQWNAHVVGFDGLNKPDGVWFTLPRTKAQYAPCGFSASCANLNQISADALNLAKTKVNLANYDNINFVLNNDLDCCAWGGSYYYAALNKVYGATWEPPWGQETGTYVHEFGHSIGLPHSGWVYYAYDSPWDMMSMRVAAKSVQCGTYKSANDGNVVRTIFCTEPGDGYIAAHKDVLGWVPPANMRTINAKTAAAGVLYTLTPNASPLSGIKMIKICLAGKACTGAAAQYLTVEARLRTAQYDKALPNEGVIIHDVRRNRAAIGGKCFFNNQSGWAVPVDATPNDYNKTACNAGGRVYPNYGLFNANFTVGKTYNNATLGVKVQVVSKTASTVRVRVTRTK